MVEGIIAAVTTIPLTCAMFFFIIDSMLFDGLYIVNRHKRVIKGTHKETGLKFMIYEAYTNKYYLYVKRGKIYKKCSAEFAGFPKPESVNKELREVHSIIQKRQWEQEALEDITTRTINIDGYEYEKGGLSDPEKEDLEYFRQNYIPYEPSAPKDEYAWAQIANKKIGETLYTEKDKTFPSQKIRNFLQWFEGEIDNSIFISFLDYIYHEHGIALMSHKKNHIANFTYTDILSLYHEFKKDESERLYSFDRIDASSITTAKITDESILETLKKHYCK